MSAPGPNRPDRQNERFSSTLFAEPSVQALGVFDLRPPARSWRKEPSRARKAQLRLMTPSHARERILRQIRCRDLWQEVQELSLQAHAIEGESDPHRVRSELRD